MHSTTISRITVIFMLSDYMNRSSVYMFASGIAFVVMETEFITEGSMRFMVVRWSNWEHLVGTCSVLRSISSYMSVTWKTMHITECVHTIGVIRKHESRLTRVGKIWNHVGTSAVSWGMGSWGGRIVWRIRRTCYHRFRVAYFVRFFVAA